MESPTAKRKLAAIIAAYVVGYSRLMGDDEDATLRTLTEYRAIMAECVDRHAGRIVDAPGDAMLAEFSSPVEALSCAVETQGKLAVRNAQLADHRRMEMRIGINLGDVIEKDGALAGRIGIDPQWGILFFVIGIALALVRAAMSEGRGGQG